MSKRRAVGIIRVSRVGDREGDHFASPGIQRGRIEAECQRLGMTLVACHEEMDVSGGKPLEQRPGLSRAVAAIEAGDANVVMVAYFDRLARSLATQTEVLRRIEDAGGDVMTLDHGTITNGGAAKRLEANIVGAMAQYFREQTAEKVGAAQAVAVERGAMIWPYVPAGYTKGDDGVLKLADTAPTIRQAFEMRSQGATVAAIQAHLESQGVTYSYNGVCKLLRNRIYTGEIKFGKLVNPTAHPAIITRELFDAVQHQIIPKGRHAPSDRLLARLGVLRCGSCGGALIVATAGSRTPFPVYRCSPSKDCSRRVSIGAQRIEDHVVELVRAQVAGMRGSASTDDAYRHAQSLAETAQGKLQAALAAFMASGTSDEPGAVERLTELREDRDRKRERAKELKPSTAPHTIDPDLEWDDMSVAARRDLIRAVVDRVDVLPASGSRDPLDNFLNVVISLVTA